MPETTSTSKIELLAPAGNWDCARAAVENGADAIYFGLEVGFNARARAANFHLGQLRELMAMLHRQAVKGYVTLNTLVFTNELPALEETLRVLASAGVDAVLVQDLGVARLVRQLCPAMSIHASTQMTLTNAAAIEQVRELGIDRAVLARELSIKEIKEIASQTTMPLEVFVHGALCVAYSGQCLTSESLGGRSANRGQCAQACRLPYDLYCDGAARDLGDVKYLLSPQDLAAHDLVPQLIEAGVCSLKIEGRLKTPEYVANVCQHYRQAIDAALAARPVTMTTEVQRELELSFSRGFSPGWLEGCDHKRLVPGTSSAKRGVLIGEVEQVLEDSILANLHAPLAAGDGIVFEGDRFAGKEFGGRVYELFQDLQRVDRVEGGPTEIRMLRGTIAGSALTQGLKIWKTDDPQLTKRLRRSFENADPQKRVGVDLQVQVVAGEPLRIAACCEDGIAVEFQSEHVSEVARKHAMTEETLAAQFGRLGGTVYRLRELNATISGSPMVPLSVLGQLRHELVERLEVARMPQRKTCVEQQVTPEVLGQVVRRAQESRADEGGTSDSGTAVEKDPELHVLCRSLQQIEQALAAGARSLIAEFHDIRQYRTAVALAHDAGCTLQLATLRIHKPGEDGLFRALAKSNADGWLVRNLAALNYCRQAQIPFVCDFSLNVTNPITAEQLIAWGARRLTASYDLNREQLLELTQGTPPRWLEVVIHQHMPMFHMEHCVFCSVLSPGKNKSDCGRPCDRHDVKLRDRVGVDHVLHADIGCRNTLYNGVPQSGAEAVAPLLVAGVRDFRVELLRDAEAASTTELINLYRSLLDGQLQGAEVWQRLKAHNRVGVTRGTLEQHRNPLAIL
jgi:U32 family peptidase